MGRHTSRLKPRTSTGRVIDSSPFSLVRGDANQRRETPENSTLGSLLLYYLVLALRPTRIQIARHNASRWRPLGASQLAFSSGAFAGRVEEGAFAVEEELK